MLPAQADKTLRQQAIAVSMSAFWIVRANISSIALDLPNRWLAVHSVALTAVVQVLRVLENIQPDLYPG